MHYNNMASAADICRDAKDNPEPDTGLRHVENIPLGVDIGRLFYA